MKTDSVPQIKKRIAVNPLYGNRCYVCENQFTDKKRPVIHHRWYTRGKRRSTGYPQTAEGQLEYHINLEKEVHSNPKQFMMLCNKHHIGLHKIKRYKNNLPRMLEAVRMTA